MPVAVPAGVTVTIAENNEVTVKGPKGTLDESACRHEMTIKEEDGQIVVTRPNDLKQNEIFTRSDQNPDQQHGSLV